ncbi:hypothetical protein GCM10017044_21790 [Kordiimonas sediminis]|uniref:DUF1476 domain-containing protein n=1 Tax=Kordiimonas sediminis TaxID=1735581 RepID=A0A919E7I1_9PROT|nr:DUF1476 domain-containing protein [Kordiimonas sediminis]GHF26468.1 hypothetical protein GCM10017044_21790 [Kordiimonas sediminis]
MTTFDNREKAFENKFAHDEELMFKARARRNRLVGEWAAKELGKADDEVEAYAKSVVIADLEEEGDDDVIRKLKADFEAAGVEFSDHRIEKLLEEKLHEAIKQVQADVK